MYMRLVLGVALAVSIASGDVDSGVRLVEARRYAEARPLLEKAVRERPDDARAAEYLGRALFGERQPDEAARWLEKAAALDPSSSSISYWLGRAWGDQAVRGNLLTRAKLAGKIRRAFEHAIELDSANVDARMALLEFHLRAPSFMGGSLEKASIEAEEIRRLDPFRGHRAIGRIHESHRRFELAIAEYEAAIRDFPTRPNPYFWIEDVAVDRKDWPAAFIAMERLHRAIPEDSEALYEIGRLAAISGRELERGEAALRQYLEREPNPGEPTHALARLRLGEVLEARGDRGAARTEYTTAIQLDPALTEARRNLTRVR
jgi:tetratricopeptide (TPR) repeat protein